MTLKWQQVAVGGFVSLFFLLGGLLNLTGVSYSHDGDKICTDCFSEIKIFSTFWVIKAGNYTDEPVLFKKVSRSRTLHVNLDKIDEFVETNPKVKVEILVPAIKRTSTMNHPEYGYLRPLKHGDTLIYRNNANRKAPSRIIIHGINVTGTVKWGFELEHFLMEDISIDPKWIGKNKTIIIEPLINDTPVNDTFVNDTPIDDIPVNDSTVNETPRKRSSGGGGRGSSGEESASESGGEEVIIPEPLKEKTRWQDNCQTKCENGKCNVILGQTFWVNDSDNNCKLREEAMSLKNSNLFLEINSDGIHEVECYDFNWTHRDCRYYLNEKATELNKDIPISIVKINNPYLNEQREKEEPVDIDKKYIELSKQNIKFVSKEDSFRYNLPIKHNEIIKFGVNSTTIKLQDANTENLDDTATQEDDNATDNGDNTFMRVGGSESGSNRREIFIKFNITGVPSGQIIDNATLYMYVYGNGMDPGESVILSSYHVFAYPIFDINNQEWTEGDGGGSGQCTDNEMCWNNIPISPQYNTTTSKNLTANVTTPDAEWISWEATGMVSSEYIAGNNNISIWLRTTLISGAPGGGDSVNFRSKEYGTVSLRPFLNITYSESDLTAPTYSDNSTNSTIAGTNIMHRLNWNDETGLSGYIFSFCDGTWNGSDCVEAEILYESYIEINQHIAEPLYGIGWAAQTFTIGNRGINNYFNISSVEIFAYKEGLPEELNISIRNVNGTGYPIGEDLSFGTINASLITTDVGGEYIHINMSSYNLNASTQYAIVFRATGSVINWILYYVDKEVSTYTGGNWFTSSNSGSSWGVTYDGDVPFKIYGSGGWVNDSFVSMTGMQNWSNVSKLITSNVGVNVSWCVYAYDTSNNLNSTSCDNPFVYTTTAGVPPPTKDTTPPIINGTANKSLSTIIQNDVINFTYNATDEINLTNGTIVINDTGFKRYFNFSLNGSANITLQFSQNFTVSCGTGCVINVTGIARDNSSNIAINDTVFTLLDLVPPVINCTFNISVDNIETGSAINFSCNMTDETGLTIGNITNNMSGVITYSNYTLSGTTAAMENTTIVTVKKGSVINFTGYVHDGVNTVQNSTLITVTIDNIKPIINGTLNKSLISIELNDIINATFNATDETALDNGTIIINDTGFNRYFNFSLTGTKAQFSQNFTIRCGLGCVINITGRVDDTSGNIEINDTVFTVTDNTLPIVNATLNKSSNVVFGDVINLTANATDDNGLSFGQIIVNDTGFIRFFNFSLTGTEDKFSQNISVACFGGCVINFTARVNDTNNNFATNDTLITVIDNINPFINGTLNESLNNIGQGDTINATFDSSDEVNLDTGQIIVNDTGFKRYFNFSLSGGTAQFSQNFTISCSTGCVVNVTGLVNDTSNNLRMNDTIFTVVIKDEIPPSVEIGKDFGLFYKDPTNNSNILFNWSAKDNVRQTFTVTVDINGSVIYTNNSFLNGTDGKTIFTRSEGVYNISLNVSDISGNKNSTSTLINIQLVVVDINFTLEGHKNNTLIYSGNNIQFNFTVNFSESIDSCYLFINDTLTRVNESRIVSNKLYLMNGTNLTLNNDYEWLVGCNTTIGGTKNSTDKFNLFVYQLPSVSFISPTPANNSIVFGLFVPINVSTVGKIDSYVLDWDGTNETVTPNSTLLINKTGLLDSTDYTFRVYVNDTNGNWNFTEERLITTNELGISVIVTTDVTFEFRPTVENATIRTENISCTGQNNSVGCLNVSVVGNFNLNFSLLFNITVDPPNQRIIEDFSTDALNWTVFQLRSNNSLNKTILNVSVTCGEIQSLNSTGLIEYRFDNNIETVYTNSSNESVLINTSVNCANVNYFTLTLNGTQKNISGFSAFNFTWKGDNTTNTFNISLFDDTGTKVTSKKLTLSNTGFNISGMLLGPLTNISKINITVENVSGTKGLSGFFIDNLRITDSGLSGDACYQESANITTTCGGLSTGGYTFIGDWVNPGNATDGDWDTYASRNLNSAFLEINYTKPAFANSAIWTAKNITPQLPFNMTIPLSCWNYNDGKIVLRDWVESSPSSIQHWECKNTSNEWQELSQYGQIRLYEEAIWWNLNDNSLQSSNIKMKANCGPEYHNATLLVPDVWTNLCVLQSNTLTKYIWLWQDINLTKKGISWLLQYNATKIN